MNAIDFEYLLSTIGPRIAKRDTNMRRCIPVQERLAVALRFLATGDSFISLSYLFKISKELVSICVEEVCMASGLGWYGIHVATQEGGRRAPQESHQIRNSFAEYFVTNGQVPWKENM